MKVMGIISAFSISLDLKCTWRHGRHKNDNQMFLPRLIGIWPCSSLMIKVLMADLDPRYFEIFPQLEEVSKLFTAKSWREFHGTVNEYCCNKSIPTAGQQDWSCWSAPWRPSPAWSSPFWTSIVNIGTVCTRYTECDTYTHRCSRKPYTEQSLPILL